MGSHSTLEAVPFPGGAGVHESLDDGATSRDLGRGDLVDDANTLLAAGEGDPGEGVREVNRGARELDLVGGVPVMALGSAEGEGGSAEVVEEVRGDPFGGDGAEARGQLSREVDANFVWDGDLGTGDTELARHSCIQTVGDLAVLIGELGHGLEGVGHFGALDLGVTTRETELGRVSGEVDAFEVTVQEGDSV
jgi:hypothetical protein